MPSRRPRPLLKASAALVRLANDTRRALPLGQSIPIGIFRLHLVLGKTGHMPCEQKLTLGDMRRSGARRLHVLCGDPACVHSVVIDTGCWPQSLRLSDLKALFVCTVCGHRGADVRGDPDRTRRPMSQATSGC